MERGEGEGWESEGRGKGKGIVEGKGPPRVG